MPAIYLARQWFLTYQFLNTRMNVQTSQVIGCKLHPKLLASIALSMLWKELAHDHATTCIANTKCQQGVEYLPRAAASHSVHCITQLYNTIKGRKEEGQMRYIERLERNRRQWEVKLRESENVKMTVCGIGLCISPYKRATHHLLCLDRLYRDFPQAPWHNWPLLTCPVPHSEIGHWFYNIRVHVVYT